MWAAASCAATCCAYCACEACKGAISGIGRRSAKIAYVGLFALCLVLAWVVRDYAEPVLHYVAWLDTLHLIPIPTAEWLKTQGALRVTFAAFLFFVTLALLLANVEDESDDRDSWHHGGWMVKLILLLGCLMLSFLVPDAVIDVYAAGSFLGSAFFLFVQIVLLIDFTHAWNEAWLEKDEDAWYMAMLVISVACYILTAVGLVLLFVWFSPSGQDCEYNSTLLVLTLVLIVAFTATSLQEQVNGSLLPSSVIALYCGYLAWAGLSSEPTTYVCNGLGAHRKALSGSRLALSVLLTLLSVAYSALRAGSSSRTVMGHEEQLQPLGSGPSEDVVEKGGLDSSGRSGPVAYNYSFFHLVFAAAAMYCGMLLTGWGSSEGEGAEEVIDVGWRSVQVKVAQQWATGLLYTWSLVAPLLLPDRDFS